MGDYTPEELDDLLRQRKIDMGTIPERVRAFIRNPRICSVALDLLDRLAAQADELTIERLLLEYWRRRLEERGDLIAHDVRDFEKLLRSHAKALRDDPGVQFDRDDWRKHSGAAQRGDGRSVEHDLTEIEEGAFLRLVEDRDGFYEFKPDTVPFALGLLVARELHDELRKSGRNPTEVIDSIVEEVQGFDLVAEALRAAAGIACFEANFPPEGRAALISAWLELQNVPDLGYESLAAYATACPEAALDATEAAFDERANARRRQWLLGALLDTRDRPRVASALQPRVAKWLARWSRRPRRLGPRDEREEARLRESAQRISHRLNALTPAEQGLLARACEEVDSPEAMQLDAAAALLMAGRPQAAFAESVLAWAFVWALTGDFRRADADLSWAVRLNRQDFAEFEAELRHAVAALLDGPHSEVGRSAAAIVLRVLGTVAASEEADLLSPRQAGWGWRRVENYCQTDPFDPASVRPANIVNAIREASAIDPAKVWLHMSPGEKDHELEWITPGLARFELETALVEAERESVKLRRVLFFASAYRPELTGRAREVIGRALQHDDPVVVTCASDLAYYARDAQLDELVISAARQRGNGVEGGDEAFWRARAVAAAVVTLKRTEDTVLIAPRFLGFAAKQLRGQLDRRVATELDLTVQRLLSSVRAAEPQMGQLFLDIGRSGQDSSRRVEDRAEEDEEGSIKRPQGRAAELSGPRQEIDEFAERQKALREEADAYLTQLSAERAQALAREPDIDALKRVAKQDPNKVAEWASRILAETDEARLSTIRNLALGLAEAVAEADPRTAAALLSQVATTRSPISIVRGDARVPQEIEALFSGPDIEPLATLRAAALEEAMSDADIQMLVFAAEAAGHSTWLQGWIDREAASGMPGRIARALTVEGLRNDTSQLLTRDWGSGFLGHVAKRARYAYDRNVWARGWADQIVHASDPVDFWGWGELTTGIADVRAFHWFDPNLNTPMLRRFGSELFKRIRKAAESRTKKRKGTLFGVKKPDRALSQLLSCNRRTSSPRTKRHYTPVPTSG